MMHAVVVTDFGAPDVMQYRTVDVPVIGPHQVLIRVVATSVNFADVKARYGNRSGGKQPPFIPGLDAAGVIEQVGLAVSTLHIGQRVIAFPQNGSYAEYVVAKDDLTFVIPDELDFETAAASPIVAFTAYKLLADVARLASGERVLIHAAAGGVGTTASQLAKILGASLVIGTVGHASKVQTARDAGCDHVIVSADGTFPGQVNALTQGRGVDVILDSIAGDVTSQSLDCLANYGRLVQFGNASGKVGHVQSSALHASCRSVLGFSLGTTRNERPHLLGEAASQVLPMLAQKQLQIVIGQRYALRDAATAHRDMENRLTTGKTVLRVSEAG